MTCVSDPCLCHTATQDHAKKNRLHKLQAHTPWKLETTLLLLVVVWLIASSYLGFNHDSPASFLISLDFLTDFPFATPNITQLGSSTVLQICQSLLIPEHSAAQRTGRA